MLGLLATNVPYGERLGDRDAALDVCRELGTQLRGVFRRWPSAVLVGDAGQFQALALAPTRQIGLYNGPLRCTLGKDVACTDQGPWRTIGVVAP